jgi:chemotaxis signal transduction protein
MTPSQTGQGSPWTLPASVLQPGPGAAQLRHDFDQSFAQAPPPAAAAMDDYLAIRLGADPHALRLADIASLAPLVAPTRVPGPCPELLGLTGFRGRLLPVYDLRALLGYAAPALPRWRVIALAWPVALAFDGFEGHLRLPREAAAAAQGQAQARLHVREVLHAGAAEVRPIVSLESVLDTIRVAARPGARNADL